MDRKFTLGHPSHNSSAPQSHVSSGTIASSVATEHFSHCRECYWTTLLEIKWCSPFGLSTLGLSLRPVFPPLGILFLGWIQGAFPVHFLPTLSPPPLPVSLSLYPAKLTSKHSFLCEIKLIYGLQVNKCMGWSSIFLTRYEYCWGPVPCLSSSPLHPQQ